MPDVFEVLPNRKTGLNSPDSFIVVRGNTCYLRIQGSHPAWELMTATADEDDGRIRVCPDQNRLINAALQLCTKRGGNPQFFEDHEKRPYAKLLRFVREPGAGIDRFNAIAQELFEQFFTIYDGLAPSVEARSTRSSKAPALDDSRELYETLATDDSGGDVYLSDGLWLSSDGSVHDRGR